MDLAVKIIGCFNWREFGSDPIFVAPGCIRIPPDDQTMHNKQKVRFLHYQDGQQVFLDINLCWCYRKCVPLTKYAQKMRNLNIRRCLIMQNTNAKHKCKTQMSFPPFWGCVGLKKWSPFLFWPPQFAFFVPKFGYFFSFLAFRQDAPQLIWA